VHGQMEFLPERDRGPAQFWEAGRRLTQLGRSRPNFASFGRRRRHALRLHGGFLL